MLLLRTLNNLRYLHAATIIPYMLWYSSEEFIALFIEHQDNCVTFSIDYMQQGMFLNTA